MIPRIKGLRISNAREREQITGSEYIPFQDEYVNGKIKLSNLKDTSVYVFDPQVTDDWLNNKIITQEEYDALYNAVDNQKVIIVSPMVPNISEWNIAYGQVMLNSKPCLYIPKFIRQSDTQNLVKIEYYQIIFDTDRRLHVTKHSTPDFLQTGNGKSVLTDNGQYVGIGNLALTNMVFGDGKNAYVYDSNSDKIVFSHFYTPCVTFYSSKTGNTLNMRLLLSKATATMDGIMSKEDKIKLDTTLIRQISNLQDAITKETSDREDADKVLAAKIDKTDRLATSNLDDIRRIINYQGKPSGTAQLDSSGKVPSEQLPSYVDDVIDVYAKYDVSATGNITNIKLYSNEALTIPIVGVSDKIYVDKTPRKPSYTFRWSGTQFTHISSGGLILGTITGTAFDGGKGQTIVDGFINKIETVVEKVAMKLNGENGVELDVTCGARETGINGLPQYNNNKIVDKLQLPMVSSTQAGLATPDMYSNINTEIPKQFRAVNAKIDANKADIDEKFDLLPNETVTNIAAQHTKDIVQIDFQTNNKLGISKSQNTTIANATEQNAGVMTTSLYKALMKATQDIASLQGQIGGLGYTHPAGTAANKPQGLYKFATDATSHISSVSAVVQKDITDLGIPSNTNLTDAINNAKKEVTNTVGQATTHLKTELELKIDQLGARIDVLDRQLTEMTSRVAELYTQLSSLLDNFTKHVDDKNNPHKVSKIQIGLENVNNTSDMQKPVSTLQEKAISTARAEAISTAASDAQSKANLAKTEAISTAQAALNNHANRKDNPHVVTRAQLNLDAPNEVVFKKVTAVNGFHKE